MTTNIVLLSDGTGNSSASPFKTNVWRLYQAIDIMPPADDTLPRQIVYYDNGVGTENFKPLAALGGAFGFGAWQNVKDLYAFVCRNFQPGDQIYGFGFSRGAFTMRLLMGLIGKCGILKTISEADLTHCVQMAYEAYRRDFLIRASRRRKMIYHHILREPRYDTENGRKKTTIDLGINDCQQLFPDIRFVGVWDTVDAYGMPVDELKIAIDEWVWPMSFADRDPSDRLQTIRHALSLDDARPTFRPVLWNEVLEDRPYPSKEVARRVLSPQRIQQVWFAGAHANVGGGYPDDGLAFTALDWMMEEAASVRLRYHPAARAEIRARVNPQGEEYDSRAGIAGYYRYGPRKVAELCDDKAHGVQLPTVRVHAEAYDRVASWVRDYAPVSLGGPFSVNGVGCAPAHAEALEQAWDIVWWRRIAYFSTLALTAFLGLFAVRLLWSKVDRILDFTEAPLRTSWSFAAGMLGPAVSGWIETAWTWVIEHIGPAIGWASFLLPSFATHPFSGIVALALLAWVFFIWSNRLQRRIEVQAEWAWAVAKRLPATARPRTDWYNAVARRLRPVTAWLYVWVWRGICVNLLGLAIGLATMIVLLPIMKLRDLRHRPWMA
jgi:uncharacterized protein (DUF2235 family)